MEPSDSSQIGKNGGVKMSHFTVGVICEDPMDVDKLLAPYSENLEVEPYIGRTKEQMIEDGKRFKEHCQEESKNGIEDYMASYLTAKTDEDFYNLQKQDYCEYDKDGNELTTYNPDSKWDWYSIGGRWAGELKIRITEENGLGEYAESDQDEFVYGDVAKIKDIDFSPNTERYNECYQWWKDNVEAPDVEWNDLYKKEYFTERYKDAEEYATRNASFGTFALVTPDGEWHECGEMGWFGCSSETPEEARAWDDQYMSFIKNANPEHYFVMVDCHI